MTQSDIIIDTAMVLMIFITIFPIWLDYEYMDEECRYKLKHESKKSMHQKKSSSVPKSGVVEPYDTKAYWNNPINTDIQGFIESYTHKH